MSDSKHRREGMARVLGVVVAMAAMAAAGRAIGWPAPGVSVALGLGVYYLARGRATERPVSEV